MQRSHKPRLRIPALAALLLPALALADLPASLPEGPLLTRTAVDETTEAGIYGPSVSGEREPALVTVLVQGNEETVISSGIVLLAAPRADIQFLNSPPASGWAIPNGQWSPGDDSEWRQLLPVNPGARWALGALTMAHVQFQGSSGDVLDAVLSDPDSPQPDSDPALRSSQTHDRTALAFVADEDLRNRQDIHAQAASSGGRGAHGVRFSFPITVRNPGTSFHAWLLLRMADKVTVTSLQAAITQEKGLFTRRSELPGPPVILQPGEGEAVGASPVVEGRIQPGLLATAWVEIYPESDPETRTVLPAVRHLSDDQGDFRIPLSLPAADRDSSTLIYELHVVAESPGFRSPPAIVRLQVNADEE